MNTSKALLTDSEERRDEESWGEGHRGEEGGGKEKDEKDIPPSPGAPRLLRDLAAFW